MEESIRIISSFAHDIIATIMKDHPKELFGYPPALKSDGTVEKNGKASDLELLKKLLK